MARTVQAFAPASYSNLSVGYDILGLALSSIGDVVELEERQDKRIEIIDIQGAVGLSMDKNKNVCGVVIQAMQNNTDGPGVNITIKKGFQPGSGLGSSSASSVAAAVAYNALLNQPFDQVDLLDFALEGEYVACGARHADNVAPCLFGGLTMVKSYDPLDILQLPIPKGLYMATVFPNVEVKTADSRSKVPKAVSTSLLTQQVSSMAAFIKALYEEDISLMAQSMVDYVAEPGRKDLIPHFDDMKSKALALGALNFGISGSGPTVYALTNNEGVALEIVKELDALLIQHGIENFSFVEPLKTDTGAYII
jgi:homoserine kinase